MAATSMVPPWFLGYNVLLEVFFAVITLFVGISALRLYRLSGQRQLKLFGTAFLLISAAYIAESIANFALANYIGGAGSYLSAQGIFIFGVVAYTLFFTTALVTLAYMALKIKSPSAYALFLVLSLLMLVLSSNIQYFFYVLASVLLIYLVFFYLRNYLQNRKPSTLITFIAFLFLLFGKIHFIFAINHTNFYAFGHLLELIAYTLLLADLFIVVRR